MKVIVFTCKHVTLVCSHSLLSEKTFDTLEKIVLKHAKEHLSDEFDELETHECLHIGTYYSEARNPFEIVDVSITGDNGMLMYEGIVYDIITELK